MRFRIDRETLAEAIGWAKAHTASNSTTPILAALRLEVDLEDRLTVTGYNYDSSGSFTAPVVAAEPGTVLVSGKLLEVIVKTLPSGPAELSHADGDSTLGLVAGAARFNLPVLPLEDYPTLPVAPPVIGVLRSDDLIAAFRAVRAARASTKIVEGTPVLGGANLILGPTEIIVAATDRYRMAVYDLPWEPMSLDACEGNLVVPFDFLASFVSALSEGQQVAVSANLGENATLFGLHADRFQGVTSLIALPYGKVTEVLARFAPSVSVELLAEELRGAARRAASVINQLQAVHMIVAPDEITLTVSNADHGTMEEALPVKIHGSYEAMADKHGLDDGAHMWINPDFLTAGLDSFPDGPIYLHITGHAKRPVMLTTEPLDSETLDHRYMTMAVDPAKNQVRADYTRQK